MLPTSDAISCSDVWFELLILRAFLTLLQVVAHPGTRQYKYHNEAQDRNSIADMLGHQNELSTQTIPYLAAGNIQACANTSISFMARQLQSKPSPGLHRHLEA